MSKITITIDEQPIEVEKGELLIRVLKREGFGIPYFCYHDALGADGNCRMCMVELAGAKRPQIACDTFVKEGMEVRTKSKAINQVRRKILELELINHPVDCPICDQAGECSLQDFYMDYGLHESRITMSEKVHGEKHVDLGSNVVLDQERCVLCARCTRFTAEITQTNELGIIGRGDHARVSTMPGRQLDNPYAMNVVDLCPVGALTSKDFRFHQRVWFLESTPSVCHGCAKNCSIHIDHNREKYKDDVIYRFRPRVNMEVNGHFICDAGRLSYKELQENRQLEILHNEKSVDAPDALDLFGGMVEAAKGDVLIMAGGDLYNEEYARLAEFAQKIGAEFCVPLECYEDELFGDDWLKSSQRAANAAGVRELGISTRFPQYAEVGLLINVNHPRASDVAASKTISFLTHGGGKADLTLPLAVFSEAEGSLTNEDGVTQWCQRAVVRNAPIPSLTEWLDRIDPAQKAYA